jgi:hypothetical protein
MKINMSLLRILQGIARSAATGVIRLKKYLSLNLIAFE